MLNKKSRLHKSKEIKQVLARGRAFFNPFFLGKKFDKDTELKFTVVVSTKVSKKAVVRNRIKRIVREVIKQNIEKFETAAYIFTAKPKIMEIYDKGIAVEFSKFIRNFEKRGKINK